jgi:DUF4097 and DUF4098 domain-containing protein YvlB
VKKNLQLGLALLLLAPLGLAQQSRITQDGGGWTQEVSGSLTGVRNLRIQVEAGGVQVLGGSQNGITYTYRSHANTSSEEKARRVLDAYKVNGYVRGDTAWIVGEIQHGGSHRIYGDFVINVPRDIERVKIETGGGSVSVHGIAGRLEAETGGGKMKLEDIGGAVSAETGGDTIEAMSIGGDLTVQTGGGKLYLGPVKGVINASTGGGEVVMLSGERGGVLESGAGDIQVKQSGGMLKISTGGGNIDLGDVNGSVEIETGGGSIRVGSAKGLVRAETGSGRIELNGVPCARVETGAGGIVVRLIAAGNRQDSSLETAVGDITVYLPANLNVTVQAAIEAANGHKIYSELQGLDIRMENGDWPHTVTADGNLNGGGPILKVQTASGNIWFRRATQ